MKYLPSYLAFVALLSLIFAAGCQRKVETEVFGTLEDGTEIEIFTLENANGMIVRLSELGAGVQAIIVPDRDGNFEDIALGYDDLNGYVTDDMYQGYVVGRYGNRLKDAKFVIDGETYQLDINNNDNQLHGGTEGFHKKVWEGNVIPGGVSFTYTSPDGEMGYPGTLEAKVTFKLNDNNELSMLYEATTDKATHVNLTQHTYYNLSGDVQDDILGHLLMINADHITPVDDELIPSGELGPVEGTPFDFREPTAIGARINESNEQLTFGGGYDHNFALNDWDGTLKVQAELYHPDSGRVMEILTDQPGLQFYSGNFMDGSRIGKNDKPYIYRHGLCLETQHFPDAPNHENFASTLLKPGENYRTETVVRFSTK